LGINYPQNLLVKTLYTAKLKKQAYSCIVLMIFLV